MYVFACVCTKDVFKTTAQRQLWRYTATHCNTLQHALYSALQAHMLLPLKDSDEIPQIIASDKPSHVIYRSKYLFFHVYSQITQSACCIFHTCLHTSLNYIYVYIPVLSHVFREITKRTMLIYMSIYFLVSCTCLYKYITTCIHYISTCIHRYLNMPNVFRDNPKCQMSIHYTNICIHPHFIYMCTQLNFYVYLEIPQNVKCSYVVYMSK